MWQIKSLSCRRGCTYRKYRYVARKSAKIASLTQIVFRLTSDLLKNSDRNSIHSFTLHSQFTLTESHQFPENPGGGLKKRNVLTYFSLWYCFMLFQQEIQIIAITIFKNCTEPKDIHKISQEPLQKLNIPNYMEQLKSHCLIQISCDSITYECWPISKTS